jgi:DNA mismatch repair protein MutL
VTASNLSGAGGRPPTIRLLPEDLSNQIAAGEVVERPASVVKELLENAVDAGARRIRVDVETGGVELVRVADDGAGMDRADATMAVLRHATSKIARIEDLGAIRSFGFRGEALPSIASVSRFELRTRQSGDAEGTLVRVEGGAPAQVLPAGCAAGTVVEVRELFFNVPARRKFLKATATESARITEVVEAAALGEPGVTFVLSRDGRVVGEWPRVATREERVRALFPGEELTPCRGERGPLRIEAYLSRPERARTGATQLLLFVNGRPVRDRALSRSVALSYGSVLEAGRYPQGAVYLELPHELVDVNVHPQKAEIRFADGRAVGDALFKIVSAAVRAAFNLPDAGGYPGKKQKLFDDPAGPGANAWVFDAGPGVFPGPAQQTSQPQVSSLSPNASLFPQTSPPQPPSPRPGPSFPESKLPGVPGQREGGGEKNPPPLPPLSAPATVQRAAAEQGPGQGEGGGGGEVCANEGRGTPPAPAPAPIVYPTALELAEAASRERKVVFGALRFVGQVRSTFFVCEGSDGLYLLDQHAAAERVTFHRLKRAFDAREVASQKMLFPVIVEVSASEAALVEEQHETIGRTGLEVRAAGPSRVAVHAVPLLLVKASPERLLRDLLDEVSHAGERAFSGAVDRAIATMACHGSLRAGDPVAPDEAKALLTALDEADFAGHCPHGRPVVMRIGWGELEHRVGRK